MTHYSQRKDRAFAVIMVLLSAAFLLQSLSYPPESSQFPRFLMGVQLIFSLIFLFQQFRQPLESKKANNMEVIASLAPAFKVFLITSLYVLAIDFVGYFSSTAIFLIGAMTLFGNRRMTAMAVITACFLALIYALFVLFMGVRLPQGFLF